MVANSRVAVDWEKAALRRAEFLLQEAKSGNWVYDAAVRYALRVISNWATVGADRSSEAIKFTNQRLSAKALALYKELDDDLAWHKLTTNEHQEPISQVWEWVVREARSLQPEAILERFKLWPMVTITCEEDRAINAAGHRSKGCPQVRHSGIDVVILEAPLGRRSKQTVR